MDSYNFHFERMSNVDLHPLSLPVSRLSPAKSNSSIVDQFAHHQHGKGDSAYSSFSGGSNAPDYPSSFLAEELQSNSFGHYADLKYVKSIYHPSQLLQSDSKTMDQLYRSVEAISQQYRNNNHHNSNESFHTNNKATKQEVPLGAPIPYSRPPPVPARLDSFIATKNLENNRVQHHGTESQPQQPQPQQPRPHQRLHRQSHGLRSGPANTEMSDPDPVYGDWRAAAPQSQQLPCYRLHLKPQDQTRVPLSPEYLSVTDNKAASEQKSTNVLSRSPPRGTSQSEHLKPRQPSSSGGSNGHFESQRKRAHSAHDLLGAEPTRAASPWNAAQSVINSSIQHKGQFYFVTGVCKSSESGLRTQSVSVCGSDAGSESSSVFERQQLREKERCHSTMDNLFKPLKESSRSSSGVISDGKEGLPYENQGKDLISKNLDQENHRPSLLSTRSSRSFDSLEEIDMSREIGRHTANNPIFYCGPDRNCSPHPSQQMKEVASLLCNDQSNPHKRDEPAKRGKRQPLTDVASQRINKETTPLLYHLTGASRAALQPKKDADFSAKGNEGAPHKASSGDLIVNNSDRPPQGHATKSDREENSNACNTLDDSFKKYYKEKLKDAQSKVLRETSFKRRDLQLSWPHRIRQKPELRPTVIHSFSSSQDSGTSTDTLTPSMASEETEKGSIKEEAEESQKEVNKETEKENGRPAKVAQPQVARIKGRKRLTPEQKKMCYSEPDKLNQLGSAPKHSACRSFGNESEGLFPLDYDREEHELQGEQGLVAARRKMFETRGRALSASSASKTNLKHLRHKALVEYMERKTGHKMAEPQQPAAQQPPPPRQRHSLGEKPFDWGPRPLSAHHEGKTPKKKPNRPHSAGRILDSSTSSIRYAQFFPAQSSPGQYPAQSNESRWRESQGPSQGKFASAESLLDEPEPPKVFRNRSTSTPHAFQAHDFEQDPLPVNTMETPRPEVTAVGDMGAMLPPEAQRRERVVAQRGKSMEELGASKLTRVSALSKSSEQLDQIRRRSAGPAASERDKRNVSFFAEVREARGQERVRNEAEEAEKSAQGQADVRRRSLLKQNSEPALGEEGDVAPLGKAGTRTPSRSASPAAGASARARVHSASPRSHSPATEELRLSRPPSETPSNPPSPRGQETSEREIKSTSSSPTQTKPPCEGRLSARSARTSPSVTGAESEQSVDESGKEDAQLESKGEVSLSCGVTTDPSLWLLPAEDEEDIKGDAQSQPLTDDVFEPPPSSTLPPHTTEASAPASPSDVTQRDDTERNPETQEPEESPEAEERATVEGEGEREEESPPLPTEKPRWEELVEAVVKADPSLVTALYPLANRKTALMLMEQLLSEDTLLMEEHYKKKQEQRGSEESAETVEVVQASPQLPAPDNAEPAEPQSKADLTEKKHLLVSHLEERLRSLEESRGALQAEVLENAAHGEALRELVAQRCQPLELERYSQFIGDLERVVSLLLCLSARLARVQNALSTVDQHTDADEKQSLDSRHRLLCKQREDAKDLKDNLDRRESQVSAFLSRQLTAEQLQGYRRFVQTKASLLIRQKDLEERLRLGHEQLEALSASLNL